MEKPLVSVVIATYNMGQYLDTAIKSILAQTWTNIEVVIVDDGSTDDTVTRMNKYNNDSRIKFFSTENQGQPKAKNRGIKEATGEFIAFCDADDFWVKDKLEMQMPLFSDEKVGVVYSEVSYVDEHDNPYDKKAPYERYSGIVTDQMLLKNFVPFGTSVIRRACVEKNGMFDEQFRMGIDWDLWLRYSLDWQFSYCPEKTYVYREWSGQMSKNHKGRYDFAFKILSHFVEKYGDKVSSKSIRLAWADMYVSRGVVYAKAEGTFIEPFKDIIKGIFMNFTALSGWLALARLILRRY